LGTFHTTAREVYAFVETMYRELNGVEKMLAAMDFFEQQV
jgi:hypothetical protein